MKTDHKKYLLICNEKKTHHMRHRFTPTLRSSRLKTVKNKLILKFPRENSQAHGV